MLYEIRKEIENCKSQIRNCENAIVLNKVTLKCILVDNYGVDEAVKFAIDNLQKQYSKKKALEDKIIDLNNQLATETWELKREYAKEKLGICCK